MKSNYDKNPGILIQDISIWTGWDQIINEINSALNQIDTPKKVLILETYTGIHDEEIITAIRNLGAKKLIISNESFKKETVIRQMTQNDVTDDRIFGFMTRLRMQDFLDPQKIEIIRNQIIQIKEGLIVIYGSGSSLIFPEYDLLAYADMARWEIQNRMKTHNVHGLGVDDHEMEFSHQYKRGYFVDWRVCDRHKQKLYQKIDFVLDTNTEQKPKMIRGMDFLYALHQAANQPFRVVPYFDPGPWGGQWMKEVCDLDKEKDNFAWCFDCVPEENSLKFFIDNEEFETPSINLVLTQSTQLLGQAVEERFGKEFPIRFDFLDTMDGGNLSFQV
ncbi:MAG: mannose-6-phosphate isomerase, partial [Bacteroidota bacterium]|nr:mannose-6-phosphate isomerase [Bacteroidota bacterium]